MTLAIYPGSFNCWHKGHTDILQKALKVFDKVIVALGYNPSKGNINQKTLENNIKYVQSCLTHLHQEQYDVISFDGFLFDAVRKVGAQAVIRGLRNGHDLQYEMNQQYWNEDLGLDVPFVYFVADRKVQHVSSSAIREIQNIQSYLALKSAL